MDDSYDAQEDMRYRMRTDPKPEINERNTVANFHATRKHNWIAELASLEKKRIGYHSYIMMKLEERDYHGIADCAMDLRELDARSKAIKEWVES